MRIRDLFRLGRRFTPKRGIVRRAATYEETLQIVDVFARHGFEIVGITRYGERFVVPGKRPGKMQEKIGAVFAVFAVYDPRRVDLSGFQAEMKRLFEPAAPAKPVEPAGSPAGEPA